MIRGFKAGLSQNFIHDNYPLSLKQNNLLSRQSCKDFWFFRIQPISHRNLQEEVQIFTSDSFNGRTYLYVCFFSFLSTVSIARCKKGGIFISSRSQRATVLAVTCNSFANCSWVSSSSFLFSFNSFPFISATIQIV
jgi:hypothetical protein